MILIVNINPSLDVIFYTKGFHKSKVNRSYKEEIVPGGKGINVAKTLKAFGEGKFCEAKEYFNMACEIEPENPEYLRGLGLVEFLLDNFDTAENILREVLKRDPENSAARDNLIELLIRIGKVEEAEKEISEFRRKDPKDWQILYRVQELRNKKEEIKKGGSS